MLSKLNNKEKWYKIEVLIVNFFFLVLSSVGLLFDICMHLWQPIDQSQNISMWS
jgi:hypothetical protein